VRTALSLARVAWAGRRPRAEATENLNSTTPVGLCRPNVWPVRVCVARVALAAAQLRVAPDAARSLLGACAPGSESKSKPALVATGTGRAGERVIRWADGMCSARTVIASGLLGVLVSCASISTSKDSWWSEPANYRRSCSASSVPRFVEISKDLRNVLAQLKDTQLVAVTPERAAHMTNTSANEWPNPYVVRALRTLPSDGAYALTICGDTLFVGYVAPPAGQHYGTSRSALVINLVSKPANIFVTADEGLK
jgi:hypothetical protein